MVEMKPKKEKVSLSVEKDVIEELKVLAYEHNRSLSNFINLLLREYLNIMGNEKEDVFIYGSDKTIRTTVNITLDKDIIIKIKKLSDECDRSFSKYVNLRLKKYLHNQNI